MSQIAYVNGHYIACDQFALPLNDRGYHFADSVYDVVGLIDGVHKDKNRHLARLKNSLAELDIPLPMPLAALEVVVDQIIRRNHLRHGSVYIQVSRGFAPREHSYHATKPQPLLTVIALPKTLNMVKALYRKGMSVQLEPDIRWQRCDIKSVGLLPNCMAKSHAQAEGADDAWLYDSQGMITEGTSANAWIVDQKGVLRTRHMSEHILRGITRTRIIGLESNVTVSEEAFTTAELLEAREAFQSSASAIRPVTKVNGQPIGGGQVGHITRLIQRCVLNDYSPHLADLLGIDT